MQLPLSSPLVPSAPKLIPVQIPADSDTIATELDRRNAGAASRYPLFESAATLLRLAELVKLPRTFTTDDSELGQSRFVSTCLADTYGSDSASLVENERFSHHLPSLLRLSLAVLRLQPSTTLTIEERCTAFLAFSRWAPLSPMDTSTVSVLSSCAFFSSYFFPLTRLQPCAKFCWRHVASSCSMLSYRGHSRPTSNLIRV